MVCRPILSLLHQVELLCVHSHAHCLCDAGTVDRGKALANHPNATTLSVDNDAVVSDALQHVLAAFGSFDGLPTEYSYRDHRMVLAMQSVANYLPDMTPLQWYVITALPTTAFQPDFTPKITASVIVVVAIAVGCVLSVAAIRKTGATDTGDDSNGGDNTEDAEPPELRQRKLTALAFFVGGLVVTAVLLSIWVAGQQAVVEDGVDGISASVATRVNQYVRNVMSIPTQITSQSQAFVGTRAIDSADVGVHQSDATRTALLRYLVAQASAAALQVCGDARLRLAHCSVESLCGVEVCGRKRESL